MDSLETKFEEQYTKEAIDGISLDKREYILHGLRMLEVFTNKNNWYAGYYYENDISGEDNNISLNVKKFLAKLYDLEDNLKPETKVEGLIRHLPGEVSLLKLDQEYYLLFEHSELDSGNKVRKLKLIKREECVGTKESLFQQIDHKIQSLKDRIQLYENDKIDLSKM
jgi:hypothetical protein